MNNKDLIITIARRLDSFKLDEIVVVSELEEQEVKNILTNLIKEQIIIKNGNTYFFNIKKSSHKNTKQNSEPTKNIKPIIIEEEDGYDYFLTLKKETQHRIRGYVALLNIVQNTGEKNIREVVKLFNQTSEYDKIPYSTFSRKRSQFKRYGFKGLLPQKSSFTLSYIPEELYNGFKKFYLNNQKLSTEEALYQAQIQLQKEQKIEQPYAYSTVTFIRKLKSEFNPEQIAYFRNNIKPPKTKIQVKKEIQEPLDMLFKDAADIYFKRLKIEKKQEKIMHEKTDYKNHLKDYFGNLMIREITTKVIAKYKQNKFDNGFALSSVKTYIMILKNIIKEVCPNTNKLVTRKSKAPQNSYALNMNILSDYTIKKLLCTCHKKYPETYPILHISLSSGASVPELLGLTWDRVNFEENSVSLKYFLYGKHLILNKNNGSRRFLKIDTLMSNYLRKIFNETKQISTDFVFKFPSEELPQLYVEKVLQNLSQELNIPRIYPSDLRHNFVNLCLKQKISPSYIRKVTGFYSLKSFDSTYKNLIEQLENKDYYNPLEKLFTQKDIKNEIL